MKLHCVCARPVKCIVELNSVLNFDFQRERENKFFLLYVYIVHIMSHKHCQ